MTDRKKALICDDDRMMVRLSRLILTQLGFEVFEAGDGAAGLAVIRAETPHLVLLDLMMPVKDGIGVLTDLKAEGYTGSYIMVLSADDRPEVTAQVTALGAHESMLKPFNPKNFSQKIQTLVTDGRI